jgi:non-homologous end joining protein Ku
VPRWYLETMPRSIWSGTISFGLVSVPVKMHSATESKELRFHFLHKDDLAPIGYDKVRKDTGEHVDPDEIVRGFEIEKGRYVPLEDEDLDRLDIELTHSIDICDFVSLDEPFKPEKYDDRYRKELLDLIRAKAKGRKLPEPEAEEEAEVVDLMAALRESVQQTQKKQKRSTKRPRAKKAVRKAS